MSDLAPTASPSPPFAVRWALPILITGVLALAFSPIFVRLSEVGPIATAVNRMVLPLPVFWLAWAVNPRTRTATSRRDLWLLILGGAFFAGDLCVWHWSIRLTSVANSTVLANLAPVFVVLAAWVLFRETVSRLFLLGLAVAVFGAVRQRKEVQRARNSRLARSSGRTAARKFEAVFSRRSRAMDRRHFDSAAGGSAGIR